MSRAAGQGKARRVSAPLAPRAAHTWAGYRLASSASARGPLQGILPWVFYTSLITAIQAVARTLTACLVLGLPVSLPLLALGFFLVAWVYGRDRLTDGNHPASMDPRSRWISAHRTRITASTSGAGIGALLLLPLVPGAIPVVAAVLLAALAYTKPWLPGGRSCKQIPAGKTPYVALVWTLIAVAIPLAAAGARWGFREKAFGAAFFLFMSAVISINDIYDREDDLRKGVASLAVLLGEARARFLAALLSLAGGGIGWLLLRSPGLALAGLYLAGYCLYALAARGREHGPTLLLYRASSLVLLGLVWLLG